MRLSTLLFPQARQGERLPRFVPHRGRRTVRAQVQLLQQGLALGGRPGVRAAARLGLQVSVRTLLRLLRRQPLPPVAPVRILGVDDFAVRKGRRYATILIDPEQHCIIDLLPDRTAATLATWLRSHPAVAIICRGRAGPYADGASQGAPQAPQAADRWHLLHNPWEAVARFLRHQHRALREASLRVQQPSRPLVQPGDPVLPATPVPLTRTAAEQAATRGRRQARNQEIQTLFAQGKPIAEIARQVGVTRPTVRRSREEMATEDPHPPPLEVTILTPYEPYLWQRRQQGCHNAKILYKEIRRQAYQGSYPHLRHALRTWRLGVVRRSLPPRGNRRHSRRSTPTHPDKPPASC